jgi:hypothetical protein
VTPVPATAVGGGPFSHIVGVASEVEGAHVKTACTGPMQMSLVNGSGFTIVILWSTGATGWGEDMQLIECAKAQRLVVE